LGRSAAHIVEKIGTEPKREIVARKKLFKRSGGIRQLSEHVAMTSLRLAPAGQPLAFERVELSKQVGPCLEIGFESFNLLLLRAVVSVVRIRLYRFRQSTTIAAMSDVDIAFAHVAHANHRR
jgi:hypothetical protein